MKSGGTHPPGGRNVRRVPSATFESMSKRWQDMEERIDRAREARRHGEKKAKGGDRDDRPTWRDRDRKRDISPHSDLRSGDGREQPPKAKDRYSDAQAQKAVKIELQELFRDKKGDSLRADILSADRAGLEAAMAAYVEAKGALPPDAAVLEKCLDARRDRTLRTVVEAIAAGMPDFDKSAQKVLLLKIRTKARRSFDAKLGKQMKALLSEYGVED